MKPQFSSGDSSYRAIIARFNRVLGDINIILFAVAIGLVVLDLTCFVGFRVASELTRPNASPAMSTWSLIGPNVIAANLEGR
jgi:hypothetical protein